MVRGFNNLGRRTLETATWEVGDLKKKTSISPPELKAQIARISGGFVSPSGTTNFLFGPMASISSSHKGTSPKAFATQTHRSFCLGVSQADATRTHLTVRFRVWDKMISSFPPNFFSQVSFHLPSFLKKSVAYCHPS